jgi:hypothetical protein
MMRAWRVRHRSCKEAVVGHLLGEGVLECVGEVGDEARFVEEFAGLQARQPALQDVLRHLSNGL